MKALGKAKPARPAEKPPGDAPLPSVVHEAIRSAIQESLLKPGQRMRERDVAQWLRVSRTPVREAFRMLQAQGVLSEAPGDGLVVTTLSNEEIHELYKIWADLEAVSARYAALHASLADIERLKDVCARWDPASSPQALIRVNGEFHEAICAAAHNRYLGRALDAIDDSLALLGLNTYTISGRPAEAGREHLAIVAAIARRDPDSAFAAAKAHIERAGKLRMMLFSQQTQH